MAVCNIPSIQVGGSSPINPSLQRGLSVALRFYNCFISTVYASANRACNSLKLHVISTRVPFFSRTEN
jgi:hypothetical protein